MVERICSMCQAGNPLDDRYCGKCGAPLERLLPAPRQSTALARLNQVLPVNWQQVGRTVAIGAVALAAEVGLAWLNRRLNAAQPNATTSPTTLAVRPTTSEQRPAHVVTILSQRVIEFVDGEPGKPSQIIERHVWRKIEE
jgi:hypothetical protein